MKTSEQILEEIRLAIASNNESKKKSNIALNDAIQLVLHAEKEINSRLDEEYKRGMNEAWESIRELFNMDSNEYTEVFATRVEMNSSITQTANEINMEVRKKVDENEIISKINQSAEQVQIDANKISLKRKRN